MKVNIALIAHGDPVSVTDGPYNGRKGHVIDWVRIAPDVPDVVHRVRLDDPLIVAERTLVGSGSFLVTEHTVDVVEVPASMLQTTD